MSDTSHQEAQLIPIILWWLSYTSPIMCTQLLVRDLNVYLSQPEGGERDKDLIVMLVVENLKYVVNQFRPR